MYPVVSWLLHWVNWKRTTPMYPLPVDSFMHRSDSTPDCNDELTVLGIQGQDLAAGPHLTETYGSPRRPRGYSYVYCTPDCTVVGGDDHLMTTTVPARAMAGNAAVLAPRNHHHLCYDDLPPAVCVSAGTYAGTQLAGQAHLWKSDGSTCPDELRSTCPWGAAELTHRLTVRSRGTYDCTSTDDE